MEKLRQNLRVIADLIKIDPPKALDNFNHSYSILKKKLIDVTKERNKHTEQLEKVEEMIVKLNLEKTELKKLIAPIETKLDEYGLLTETFLIT